jgi:dTDP-4-amino-4,6-dideoxygalactose transaminase
MNHIPGNSVVREFEYKISQYLDCKYALSVCNATTGILGVFYALGLRNCEIITTPLTWSGAFSGPIMLNCSFRFCDVEPQTLTINPDLIEALITPKTKAIFSSDFLGYPAKLDRIKEICDKHGLLLVHDAASSFGSFYKGYYSGHFADATIISFGEKKIFNIGEGGCILTRKSSIYRKLIKFLTHPERQSLEKGEIYPFPLNTKLNPLSAKFGLDSFDEQSGQMTNKTQIVRSWLDSLEIGKMPANSKPNYFRIIFSPEEQSKLPKEIFLNDLPFGNLVFNEKGYLTFDRKKHYCPVAEKAVNEFKISHFIFKSSQSSI